MSPMWLPEGVHYDLHVEHAQLEDAGPFTGGGSGLLWHTTESPWEAVDSMFGVLRDKRAAPHLVIGGRRGTRLPVVIQMIPFDRAGRALGNDPDGFETNRANKIQVEICGRAGLMAFFTHYRALANLTRLVNITLPNKREVPRKMKRRPFNPRRWSDAEFVRLEGHTFHRHAPDNDHTDPGTLFRGKHLMTLLECIPPGGFKL